MPLYMAKSQPSNRQSPPPTIEGREKLSITSAAMSSPIRCPPDLTPHDPELASGVHLSCSVASSPTPNDPVLASGLYPSCPVSSRPNSSSSVAPSSGTGGPEPSQSPHPSNCTPLGHLELAASAARLCPAPVSVPSPIWPARPESAAAQHKRAAAAEHGRALGVPVDSASSQPESVDRTLDSESPANVAYVFGSHNRFPWGLLSHCANGTKRGPGRHSRSPAMPTPLSAGSPATPQNGPAVGVAPNHWSEGGAPREGSRDISGSGHYYPDEERSIEAPSATLLEKQKYILRICKALSLYGAPSHRLEEILGRTSKALQVDAHSLYTPGCMVVLFGNEDTHAAGVCAVRVAQGLDLAKLAECLLIYEEVIETNPSIDQAMQKLDNIMDRKPRFPIWIRIGLYGLASAMVGPFGFRAGAWDMVALLFLGCVTGFLQLYVAPKSTILANVFEILAAILTSSFARALGSIKGHSFCFSALAQSSIALILPGYVFLCGSLELQSRNIVCGSVRMFYAIISSLMLGFGMNIGSAIYGAVDRNATSSITCGNSLDWRYNFLFVPLFTLCLVLINHARVRDIPPMVFISLAGYAVNHFTRERLGDQPHVASCLGALTVGIVGNICSRFMGGLGFVLMVPGIFVQVPSGLAAQGSLLWGIQNADKMASKLAESASPQTPMELLSLGYSVVQVAIGITIGLFTATLVVYPTGRKKASYLSF